MCHAAPERFSEEQDPASLFMMSELVPSQRTHLNVTRLETVRCNHETLAHLPFDAHLLGKEQREKAAAKEHDPEEKGRWNSGGIVSGEHEMVEKHSQGEVKDQPWPSDQVIQIINICR